MEVEPISVDNLTKAINNLDSNIANTYLKVDQMLRKSEKFEDHTTKAFSDFANALTIITKAQTEILNKLNKPWYKKIF